MEKFRYFFYKYRWVFITIAIIVLGGGLVVFGGWVAGWNLVKVFLSPFAMLCYTLAVAIGILVFATIYRKKRGL